MVTLCRVISMCLTHKKFILISGLDHSKLVFLWQQGNMYFQQILDFIVTVHSNQIAAEPHNLKLTSLPKILAEYFSDPSTALQSNETGYPFCTWKKYRILADQFVTYFSNQISTEVCEEEAIVLVDAFLKEGQCDSIFIIISKKLIVFFLNNLAIWFVE